MTSNTSWEDMRKSQGEPEGRENNGGGERGERGREGRRHRHNVEHLCKVIAAAQASVQRGGRQRKHRQTSLEHIH